jgi:hypothetical protein
MSATSPSNRMSGWSAQRWIVTVLALFGMHVAAIYSFSERGLAAPRVAEKPGWSYLISAPESNRRLSDTLVARDPTLLALVHPAGFSGLAWLRPPPLASPEVYWDEPERWLAMSSSRLGAEFSTLLGRPQGGAAVPVDKPAPSVSVADVGEKPIVTRSTLVLEGVLAGRRLARPMELPSWASAEVLNDTVIEVKVDAAGQTHSAVFISPLAAKDSVQQRADLAALALARTARFEPRGGGANPGAPPVFGRMVFRWRSTEPPDSSAVPKP